MLSEFNIETQTIGQSYRVTQALPNGAIPLTGFSWCLDCRTCQKENWRV